jgi:hypothetical protein
MKKHLYRKQDIIKVIQILNEQDNEDQDNTVVVEPEELYRILPAIDYNLNALSKLKKYRDKDIIVNGSFNISEKPIKSLGPIVRIEGNLDISHTNIASIENVTVTGRVSDWGSEMAKIKERKRVAALRAEAQSRREDGDWDIEKGDMVGLAAQAIFEYLQSEEPDNVRPEEDSERLRNLQERLGNLYYDQEQGNDTDELQGEIDAIEEDIEEIEEKIDVYSLIPSKYNFYGSMSRFEIYDGELSGREYVAGTQSDTEDAALEYAKQFIDEHGATSFNDYFWQRYLDEDGILDYFRDFYEQDIIDTPEAYFDDDDFELTSEQEERKEQLENYIEEMEQLKSDTEDEQSDLEDSDSDEYYELDKKIKEIESNIETAQNELDEIEPDTEPTQKMIEERLDYLLDDVKYDYKAKLYDFGMDPSGWVDIDAMAKGYVDEDGYGIMNSYDGTYDTVDINGETYVVMRLE